MLSEHGDVPEGVEALLDLKPGVRDASPEEQLRELVRCYGASVALGHGLTLSMLDSAENEGEERLRQAAELEIEHHMRRTGETDPEQAAMTMLTDYRTREAQLHWACQELGWPSDWVVELMRRMAEQRYAGLQDHPTTPDKTTFKSDQLNTLLPAVDLEREADLAETHGDPPEGLNPLVDLPEGIEDAPLEEQLRALEANYAELAREMVAFDQIVDDYDSDLANDLRLRLAIEAERSGEKYEDALMRWMRLRQAEEAQLVWACRELELPASSVISYLKSRVETTF